MHTPGPYESLIAEMRETLRLALADADFLVAVADCELPLGHWIPKARALLREVDTP